MNFANQLLFCNNSLITIYDDENLIFLIVKCRPTFMAPSDTTRATAVKRLMPFAESEIEIAEGREREREGESKKVSLVRGGAYRPRVCKTQAHVFCKLLPANSFALDACRHTHARTRANTLTHIHRVDSTVQVSRAFVCATRSSDVV